ncbi:MAG TPA: DinB family protein [Fimbriimonadaceae bacterium]|nr:DinB family protein [Fimbriimonadaceae bacterium]
MTTTTPHPVIDAAKSEFTRAIDRLKKTLGDVPDDRLHWSPSPTARTPLEQVAHVANANEGIQGWLQGEKLDMSDMIAVDAKWREEEKPYDTREKALARLDETSSAYLAFLDSLTPEQIEGEFDGGWQKFPMAFAITFCADHARMHTSQIEYIQTCYGDMDWHMG